jgi:multiple sugar transport system permease protein
LKTGFSFSVQKTSVPYLLIAPAILILALTIGFPIVINIYYSFFEFLMTRSNAPQAYVGLGNYLELLNSAIFWNSARVTLVFTVISVVVECILGFLLALLMQQQLAGRRLMRTLLIAPILTTPLVVGLIFRLMFHSDFGILTYLVRLLGPKDFLWLTKPVPAFSAMLILEIWQNTSFVFLVLLGAMQMLPQEPYEAARVDGAAYWQQVRHLTIPLLKPAILVALVFRMVFTIRLFEPVFVLTMGGPGKATETISMRIYLSGFAEFNMGIASSLSILLTGFTIVVAMVLVRVLHSGELQ